MQARGDARIRVMYFTCCAALGCASPVATEAPAPDAAPPAAPAPPAPAAPPAPTEPAPVAAAAPTAAATPPSPTPSADPLASSGSGHFAATLDSEKASGPPPGQDRDMIRRILRTKVSRVRDCYNAGLARDASLRGRVEVEFAISLTGATTVKNTTSTLTNAPDVDRCIANIIEDLTFPKPERELVVTYPFVLESG